MRSTQDIADNIRFDEQLSPGMIGYTINGKAVGDRWDRIAVYFNGTAEEKTVNTSDGKWTLAIAGNKFFGRKKASRSILLRPFSCTVIYQSTNIRKQ
jgi:pullulanase